MWWRCARAGGEGCSSAARSSMSTERSAATTFNGRGRAGGWRGSVVQALERRIEIERPEEQPPPRARPADQRRRVVPERQLVYRDAAASRHVVRLRQEVLLFVHEVLRLHRIVREHDVDVDEAVARGVALG